jgi:hypothetical protein
MTKKNTRAYIETFRILEGLVGSENTHNIRLGKYKQNQFGYPKSYKEGEKSGSNIYWNPNKSRTHKDGGPDDKRSYKRPAYVGLAHELGHSEALDKGFQKLPPSQGAKDPKILSLPWTPPWEENSMKRENDIRSENNITLRSYYLQSDGKTRR